jgi:hypothetical protein
MAPLSFEMQPMNAPVAVAGNFSDQSMTAKPLQTVADELDRDAMGSDTSERWIIVQTAIWQSLQEVKS